MKVKRAKVPEGELKMKPDENALGFGKYFTDHMLTMAYDRKSGWGAPEVKGYQPFSLDPAAMALHYGQAIFEGLKAYRGKNDEIFLFRPEDNLRRMNDSATRMCMPTLPVPEVLSAMKSLLDLDRSWVPSSPGATLYIRPTMIATEAALGVRPAGEYLFFVIMSPVGAYYPEGFNPVKIYVTEDYVRAAPGGVGHVKTAGNYAASIMAALEAKKKGYTQVLWLDAIKRRYIEEIGTSNIFFSINGELVTPALSGSILPGITRDSVIRLAGEWGIKVTERAVAIDEVIDALADGSLQEIFASGTAAVISPVGALHYRGREYPINDEKTGPLAQRFFDEIQAIQFGDRPDPFGWRVRL
ncbi:MAG: branched-chain amino acid aminotransferase [Proteobacteria bacterium]|nr:branched-chain amino acid aminotransferase [Pseudomonadota bacterium]MBU1738224.1 branched-chain amino acid aminotransferase [Pseudomonadota bacterium]